MRSTFHGLEVGKRSLIAQQAALSTTGHNIANTNTEGFTRRRAEMVSGSPLYAPGLNNMHKPMQVGTGVLVEEITRIREKFLDIQLRNENHRLGYWQMASDTYSRVEDIMPLGDKDNPGLNEILVEFWSSWQELSTQAEDESKRASLYSNAHMVTEQFNYMATAFDQQRDNLKNVVDVKVSEINSLAKQIAGLNYEVSQIVPHGYTAHEQYDRRDLLLDKLSKLVNVKVTEDAKTGMVDVFYGVEREVNGEITTEWVPLVSKLTVEEMSVEATGTSISITGGNPVSGELKGALDSLVIMANYRQKLDELARLLADQVNQLHQTGLYQPPGDGSPMQVSNKPFFVGDASGSIDAKTIQVNSLALHEIAAAKVGPKSDGSNAAAIASAIQDKVIVKYQSVIASLGIEAQGARRMAENSEALTEQMENRRQSVSGVSLDEEMANMIKFQQAYNAAARFISAIDETLDKVINGMGRVGL